MRKRLLTANRLRGSRQRSSSGFTVIELVIAITILTILALGIIPLVKVTVKRQKEAQLREALQQMREAIKEFHRDAQATPCSASALANLPPGPMPANPLANAAVDPRSHVVITDCTIFTLDNPDGYPPKLETLVEGVKVRPRFPNSLNGGGMVNTGNPTGNQNGNNLTGGNPTGNTLPQVASGDVIDKKKYYLARIPVDPMTGKAEWDLRSCYDSADATAWGGENVFDVHSKSTETALNGEKYSEG